MSEITRNPLCWPDSVPRTLPQNRTRPAFQERTIAAAVSLVRAEINRLNNRRWDYDDNSVIVSTNLKLKGNGE